MKQRLIGFSTGTFSKFLDPVNTESIVFAYNLSNTVEINWRNSNSWPRKNMGKVINSYFQSTSLHLPIDMFCANNEFESIAILRRAYKFFIQCSSFKYAVIHPNLIINWDDFYKMFNQDFSLPLAIENMPSRKESFKDLHSLLEFFKKYPKIKLVFDVNHWIVNGNSIESISETLATIASAEIQLAGIHLSGLGFHEPLFKTPDGKEIVKSLRDLPPTIPIIIESIFENAQEPVIELAFIQKHIQGRSRTTKSLPFKRDPTSSVAQAMPLTNWDALN